MLDVVDSWCLCGVELSVIPLFFCGFRALFKCTPCQELNSGKHTHNNTYTTITSNLSVFCLRASQKVKHPICAFWLR